MKMETRYSQRYMRLLFPKIPKHSFAIRRSGHRRPGACSPHELVIHGDGTKTRSLPFRQIVM